MGWTKYFCKNVEKWDPVAASHCSFSVTAVRARKTKNSFSKVSSNLPVLRTNLRQSLKHLWGGSPPPPKFPTSTKWVEKNIFCKNFEKWDPVAASHYSFSVTAVTARKAKNSFRKFPSNLPVLRKIWGNRLSTSGEGPHPPNPRPAHNGSRKIFFVKILKNETLLPLLIVIFQLLP